MNDEINRKNEQIASLEKQITDSILVSDEKLEKLEESQVRQSCLKALASCSL